MRGKFILLFGSLLLLNLNVCTKPEPSNDKKLAATRDYYNSPAVLQAFFGAAKASGHRKWHTTFEITDSRGIKSDETDFLLRKTKLVPQMKILDWGCGMGWLAVYLANKCRCSVMGVNISAQQLKIAREWAKQNHVENFVKFDLYDGKQLPYADSSFDLVVSQEALVHAPDKRYAYGEIFRVLKADGEFSIQDWYADGAVSNWQQLVKPIDETYKSYVTTMQASEQILKTVGFTDIETIDVRDFSNIKSQSSFPDDAFKPAVAAKAFTVAFVHTRKQK